MRNEHTAADFVTIEQPGRLASLEGDVFVPVLQALSMGLAVGLGAGVVTLLLGGPIAGLQSAELWAWSGRIGGVGTALGASVSTVVFVLGHRRALWQRERWLDRDLDGDGVIGEPTRIRVELHDAVKQQTRYVDLPVSEDQLRAVAVAVLRNGKAFSRPGLRGVLSQGRYNRLAKVMVKRGLARDLPGNKRELTGAGRAILRKALD